MKFKIRDTFNEIWLDPKHYCISIDGTDKVMKIGYAGSIGGTKILQYIGENDKNENEICEGDILKIKLPLGGFWGDVSVEKIGIVKYESELGGYIVEWGYSRNQHHILLDSDISYASEILGNIYDNDIKKFNNEL